MKIFIIIFISLFITKGYANNMEISGIDISQFNEGFKPQDSFYDYVNHNWLSETEIPDDQIGWGSYMTLREESLQNQNTLINALIKNKSKAFFLNFGTVTQLGYTNIKNKINQNYKGKPITIFDLHKQYNEDYISIHKKLFNLNATTLRLSNVYGIGHTYSKNRGIINKIIDRAISEKKITLYGDGNYVRDFIYLEDVIMGIIYALKNCNKLHKDYYYLTTEIGKSFNDLEKIINSELYKIYKFTAKVKHKKWPNTSIILDKRSFVGNSFLFKKVTGWKPKYSLRSAIRHYIHSKKITNK